MADRRSILRGMAAFSALAAPAAALASPAGAKQPKRLATMEEYAALEFEPLTYGKDFDILSEESWRASYQCYVVASNCAARLLAETKPELINRARRLMEEDDLEGLKALRTVLEDAEGMLKALAEPVTAAATRLLCCCCAVECEGGQHAR